MTTAVYVQIIFLDESAADDTLAMLASEGPQAVADHLAAEFEPRREQHPPALEPFGAPDDTYAELGDYILSWNTRLNYIGLAKGNPVQDFECTYETREAGAIGIFIPATVTAQAVSVKTAMEQAFHHFHVKGLETRNPIRCNGLTGPRLMAAMRDE